MATTQKQWASQLIPLLPANENIQILDLSTASASSIQNLHLETPIILLNADNPQILTQTLGFGLAAPCLIIKPRQASSYEVYSLGKERIEISDVSTQDVSQDTGDENSAQTWQCDDTGNGDPLLFANQNVQTQAQMIKTILGAAPLDVVGATPTLPLDQYRLLYVVLEHQWNLTDTQQTTNSLIMEVSLFASYNPQYKYLRIRSMGAGFNPASGKQMSSDDTYDRGYFQGAINMQMTPVSNRLTTLSTDPKNINGQTSYTSGSTFTVGVDISKNPSFSPSYSVSESSTTVISDFNVYNNSSGISAMWDFKYSRIEKDIWEMFSQPFMKKAQVKTLPPLATRNLQPIADAVWYAPNSLMDNVGIRLSWHTDHYRCWVEGNWSNYTMYNHRKGMTVSHNENTFWVSFGWVNA